MSEQMMPANGTFCWNELSTNDSDAAIKFYTELLGWEMKSSTMTEACEGAPADRSEEHTSELQSLAYLV